MKAVKLIVIMEDGSQHELMFSPPKPSAVSGKLNQNASGKIATAEGRWQLGCNLTKLS